MKMWATEWFMKHQIEQLEKENKNLKLTLEQMENTCKGYLNDRDELREENKKLKEELEKDNRKVQVVVDKELLKANDYLIKENKKLKEERDNCLKEVKRCYNHIHSLEWQISDLEEENKKLKVKIAKLEFDIEAWKKLKKVWEEKEKMRK